MKVKHFAAVWGLAFCCGAAVRFYVAPSADELLDDARRCLAAADPKQAEDLLRRVVAQHPGEPEGLFLLADLARQTGEWPTVVASMRQIPDDSAFAVAARTAEGDGWLRLNLARQAELSWRRAVELDPDTPTARARLLYLHGIRLQADPWLKVLWEFYDRDEAGLREMILLMIARRVVWETDGAIKSVVGFVEADAADEHSRRALARYLLRSGSNHAALSHLTDLNREHPDDVESWISLMECLLVSGDGAASHRYMALAPAAAPDDYRYWKTAGSLAILDGDYVKARHDYRAALDGSSFDLESHNQMAEALRHLDEWSVAERHAQVAASLARIERLCHAMRDLDGWENEQLFEMIRLCERLKLVEEALGWTRLGLARDPRNEWLLEVRARLATLPVTSSRRPPNLESVLWPD